MIVDDCDMMRSFLANFLQSQYQVQAFSSTQEAQRYLDSEPAPNLIVTDYNLPEVTGIDWVRSLKQSMLFQDIPVIVLSGNTGTNTRIECLEAGAIDFISKPFHPQELLLRINRELKRTSLAL